MLYSFELTKICFLVKRLDEKLILLSFKINGMSIISKKRKPEITTLSNSLQRNQHTTTKRNQTQRKKKKNHKLRNQKISKTNLTFKRENQNSKENWGSKKERIETLPQSVHSEEKSLNKILQTYLDFYWDESRSEGEIEWEFRVVEIFRIVRLWRTWEREEESREFFFFCLILFRLTVVPVYG